MMKRYYCKHYIKYIITYMKKLLLLIQAVLVLGGFS